MVYILINTLVNVAVGLALLGGELPARETLAVVALTAALNVVGYGEAVERAMRGPGPRAPE